MNGLVRNGFVLMAAMLAVPASAQTKVPPRDLAGSDLPWLKRYEGSLILDFRQVAFDEADLVAGPLKPKDGREPGRNNLIRAPESVITLQGRLTRFVYLLPEGRSPLEAVAGYKQALLERKGETLFECRDTACGGAQGNSVTQGGSEQGLIQYVFPYAQTPTKLYSAEWCVLTASNAGQRYALIKAEGAHVSVFAAQVKSSRDCGAFDGRTFAIVTSVEDKAREQRMEVVSAQKMGGDIASTGRAVLYGVLFDTDKAVIKSESKPQMEQIAAFLKASPQAKFLVVGHTDNEGAPEYNVDLSQRRAAAVAAALRSEHKIPAAQISSFGAGMAAPVASNADAAGRAKNRRVEIVAR